MEDKGFKTIWAHIYYRVITWDIYHMLFIKFPWIREEEINMYFFWEINFKISFVFGYDLDE